jgi:sortase A
MSLESKALDLVRRFARLIFTRSTAEWAFRALPLIAGITLLLYVASQYGMMFAEQHRLQQEWERQKSPSSAAADSTGASTQPGTETDGLTRLEIPKINLDAIVVEGTSRHQLAIAPGHMTETSLPGENGNAVITAHRDTFFRHLYDLEKGDSILVHRNGKTFTFEVTGKQVVEPDDFSVIRPSKQTRLTLITCYPTYYIGPAPERLVIFSRLQEAGAAPGADVHGSARANTSGAGSSN